MSFQLPAASFPLRTMRRVASLVLILAPVVLIAQTPPQSAPSSGGLDPATLLKPLGESWPTYSGDYTGRRYSALTQINQSNVKHLSLAWVAKLTSGVGGG